MFAKRHFSAKNTQSREALEQLFSNEASNANSAPALVAIKPDKLGGLRVENLNHLIRTVGSSKEIVRQLGITHEQLEDLRYEKIKFSYEMADHFEKSLGLPDKWFSSMHLPVVPSAIYEGLRLKNRMIEPAATSDLVNVTAEAKNESTSGDSMSAVIVYNLLAINDVFPNMRKYLTVAGVDAGALSCVLRNKRKATRQFAIQVEDILRLRRGMLLEKTDAETWRKTLVTSIGTKALHEPKAPRGRRPNAVIKASEPVAPGVVEHVDTEIEHHAMRHIDKTLLSVLFELLQSKFRRREISKAKLCQLIMLLES